jgi:glycosyltransferase involved in cell wall biosynthesis
MKKILVVGQTPPPYHGQALSTERFLNGSYKSIDLFHVRMSFSETIDEIGKFKIQKIKELFRLITSIIFNKYKFSIPILYYMPACSGRLPFYRDVVILITTRWLFKTTVFHFRSAGIEDVYKHLTGIERILFRMVYFEPDLAIQLSEYNPPDGEFIKAKKITSVPNGIHDHYTEFGTGYNKDNNSLNLLYIGSIRETKGVFDLLEACDKLKEKFDFTLFLVGQFADKVTKDRVYKTVKEMNLTDKVVITGELTGSEKWKIFNKTDVLCFPTYYENESFGNVLLEAMQFKIPIVATNWRAVGSIVEDGRNGYLVPIRNPEKIAEKIEHLYKYPSMRKNMGENGRKSYLMNYSIEKFHENMGRAFTHLD